MIYNPVECLARPLCEKYGFSIMPSSDNRVDTKDRIMFLTPDAYSATMLGWIIVAHECAHVEQCSGWLYSAYEALPLRAIQLIIEWRASNRATEILEMFFDEFKVEDAKNFYRESIAKYLR